ncbi:helix-turn-helix transcriptional regulator [Dermacoccus nishinomiyaensis]|uniref:helix-turn-helix transcriptional regulator n=1 Tax=Dermacoccus nishinomiyaensis TaxID=1274 RepID=UPI0013F4BA06|nr:response regulator transcription factor [Dermacoccus nishinomiyaensis]NHC31238.1 response regulator transcription factor [Dermacoccus nishinomiyaensis]
MNPLAVLGIDDLAEQLYRQVLRDQARPFGVYASRLNTPVGDVEAAAEQLRALRLVRITEDGRPSADHPRAGLERVLSAEEARHAERRRDLARLRDAIDGFAGDHRAGQEQADTAEAGREYVEIDGLGDVMEHLAASTSGPIRFTHTDALAVSAGEQPVLARLVADGRLLRGLHEFDAASTRSLDVVEWANLGEEQRLATHIPNEFVCYGTDAVIANTDWGGEGGRYVVLRDAVVVRAFVELFDRMWAAASGVDDGAEPTSERLVELMQAGLKDEAIARALGASLRTVRRRVAALMEECGVETRFQLAVKLTERGLTGFEG